MDILVIQLSIFVDELENSRERMIVYWILEQSLMQVSYWDIFEAIIFNYYTILFYYICVT